MSQEWFRTLAGVDYLGLGNALAEGAVPEPADELTEGPGWWTHQATPKQVGYALSMYKKIEHKPAQHTQLVHAFPNFSWGDHSYGTVKAAMQAASKGTVGKMIDVLKGLVAEAETGGEPAQSPPPDNDPKKGEQEKLILQLAAQLGDPAPDLSKLTSHAARNAAILDLSHYLHERKTALKEIAPDFANLYPFEPETYKKLVAGFHKVPTIPGSLNSLDFVDYFSSKLPLPEIHTFGHRLKALRANTDKQRHAIVEFMRKYPEVEWWNELPNDPEVQPYLEQLPGHLHSASAGIKYLQTVSQLVISRLVVMLDVYKNVHHGMEAMTAETAHEIMHHARRLDPHSLKHVLDGLAAHGISLHAAPAGHADPIDASVLHKMTDVAGKKIASALALAVQHEPKATSKQIAEILSVLYELGTDPVGLALPPDLTKALQTARLRDLTRYEIDLVLAAIGGLKQQHTRQARQHAAIVGLSGLL